jgi:hypothetical protein
MSSRRWNPARFSPVKLDVSLRISSIEFDIHCAAQYKSTGILSVGVCLAAGEVILPEDADFIKVCRRLAKRDGAPLLFPLLKKFISEFLFLKVVCWRSAHFLRFSTMLSTVNTGWPLCNGIFSSDVCSLNTAGNIIPASPMSGCRVFVEPLLQIIFHVKLR